MRCEEQPPQRGAGGLAFLPENLQTGSFTFRNGAHHGAISEFRHIFTEREVFVESAFERAHDDLARIIEQMLSHFIGLKLKFALKMDVLEFKTSKIDTRFFGTPFIAVTNHRQIESAIIFAADFIIKSINLYANNASGFSVDGIILMDVTFTQYNPIRVGSYIKLGPEFYRKKGLLNIRSEDGNCFKLSILASVFQDWIRMKFYGFKSYSELSKSDRCRLKRRMKSASTYDELMEYVDTTKMIRFNGFHGKVDINKIQDFEMRNKISVNVYKYEVGLKPLLMTTLDSTTHVNLLLLKQAVMENGETKIIQHFVLITDICKFVSGSSHRQRHLCRFCLQIFEKSLQQHEAVCKVAHKLKYKFPNEVNYKFRKHHMLLNTPYRIYYDFEAYIQPYIGCENVSSPQQFSYTTPVSNLRVSSYGLVVIGPNGSEKFSRFYTGRDVMEDFFICLIILSATIRKLMKKVQYPIMLTEKEMAIHQLRRDCPYCGEWFSVENPKVLHHNHYLKNAPVISCCNNCNLQIRTTFKIPAYAHCSAKFDHQFIISSLSREFCKQVKIIPKNSESFIGIEINNCVQLKDSYQFMAASLETLVERLGGSERSFSLLDSGFNYDEHVHLVRRKGVFPYGWYKGPSCHDFVGLPPKKDFYDILSNTEISQESYDFACSVYNHFSCRSFLDYLMVYLRSDVYLLASVFESFVSTCIEKYLLSPHHCWSLPGFAYEACSFKTKLNFEYLRHPIFIDVLQNNIRGGISFVNKKKATAKSIRLGMKLEPNQKETELLYYDAVNLYGWALMQPLPCKSYRELEQHEIDKFDFLNPPINSGKGWIILCDLEYKSSLHQQHNDFPLAPNHQDILENELSAYQRKLLSKFSHKLSNPLGGKKLLLTLKNKQNYAVYYKNLKFYLENGLELTKVHSVFEFEEDYIFRDFVWLSTLLRKNSQDAFSKALFKLLINAIFGQLLNIKPKNDVIYCDSRPRALELLAKHNFINCTVLDSDVSLFHMERQTTMFQKPFAAGFVVLEITKLHMYQLYYNLLKTHFNCSIIFSDTDSGILEITGLNRDYQRKLKSLGEYFDFSAFPETHYLHDKRNEGIPGKLKIEHHNLIEFIGIRSKCYSLLLKCQMCANATELGDFCVNCKKKVCVNKGKGVPNSILKKLSHSYYNKVLQTEQLHYVEGHKIQNKNHKLDIVKFRKVGFHNLDTRRHWLENGESLAFGHFDIENK